MSEKSLKKTVGILFDMELNNYMMTRALEGLDRKVALLGYHHKFTKPTSRTISENHSDSATTSIGGGYIGAIIGAIIGFFVGTSSSTHTFFAAIFIDFGKILVSTLIGAGIGIALLGIIPLICKVAAEKERVRQRRAQEESRYNGEVKKYNDAVANDKRRVSMELKQKERLIVERNELERQLNASKALLVTYYEQSGINNRFCNLIAVGYMYEYIEIGISNKLEGVDGLYNLILQKLEWNKLHHTLEEISSKLDVIIDNQRLMYQELVSMNSKCEGILDELYTLSAKVDENTTVQNQIMDNTAASAYYAERAARAGEYSNYMTAWNNIRE